MDPAEQNMPFSFKCASCGEIHEGMPSLDADAPLSYYTLAVHPADSPP